MKPMLIACLAALLVLALGAEAQTKRAFIVGVGEYENIADLQKTVGDAQGYAELFGTDLGFAVTPLINPSRAEFAARFGAFVETITPGDEVVFIFSGHGWSDGAENYLIMADAPREASEFQLKTETMPLTAGVLAQLKARTPRLTFAIIDACRDYPFDSFTMNAFERGLVRTDVSEGTLVLYAAGSRQKALDRLSNTDTSEYSVFTRVLLPKLRNADRPLQDIARDVKDEVRALARTINHVQRPAYYDELLGDYCLSGTCTPSGLGPGLDDDTRLWLDVTRGPRSMDAKTCEGYQRYLAMFPDGAYSIRASRLLNTPPCGAGAPDIEDASRITGSTAVRAGFDAMGVDARRAPATTRAPVITVDPATLPDFAMFRECEACPDMVVLPGGAFDMGSPPDEEGRGDDEGPVKSLVLKRFAIARFETTWQEWDACVAAGACSAADVEVAGGDNGWGRGRRPAIETDWRDARAYARFVDGRSPGGYRLPTEAEWEFAAKAGLKTRFAWGDGAPVCDEASRYGANFRACSDDQTRPVGSFPASPFGLFDMHGNVWEWVKDCYTADLSDQPRDGFAKTIQGCPFRVLRGGSWNYAPQVLRSANRSRSSVDYRNNYIGFRLARTL
ncbi:MAG: SUMF1/EgtB/PvdO family nonheme iron enzyme [Pseudomonadota bacterium]